MPMPAFAITNDLNWEVEQRPLFYPSPEGDLIRFEDRVAIVRSDNGFPLGVVSEGYETVQNKELLNMVNPLVEEGLLSVENIGYLNNGAKVFVQAKIAKEYRVIGEDYRAYITLLNGHVGNFAVAIGSSNIRVVCSNTFAMSYSMVENKFRHQEGVNKKVLESKAVIDYVDNAMALYSEDINSLSSSKCGKDRFHTFLEKVYEKEIKDMRESFVESLDRLFYGSAGNEGRTLYDAFNAVTFYNSHESRSTELGRFNYANFGKGSNTGKRALQVAAEMAAV